MILQLSQIFLTEARTFIASSPLPGKLRRQGRRCLRPAGDFVGRARRPFTVKNRSGWQTADISTPTRDIQAAAAPSA
jgi:hypothetical protein